MNRFNKAERFNWNKEIERDFIELIKVFTKGRIQPLPDFGVGYPFILTMDWSKESVITSAGRTGEIPRMLGKEV